MKRHQKCIMGSTMDVERAQPTARDSADIMRQLTVGISCQNEVITHSNVLAREEIERKIDKEEEKKNKFSKLHASFKNMLLMAFSTDGDRAASTLTPSCKYFFEQETVGVADQYLQVLFRDLGMPDVGFAHGVIQAFLSGQFLYSSRDPLPIFRSFAFTKLRDKFDNQRRLLIHLKAKDGKARTNEEINESIRQVVKSPSGFNVLKEQLKIFGALNQIFVGKDAMSTRGIWELYKDIKQHKSFLKHKCYLDIILPTKICSTICSKI